MSSAVNILLLICGVALVFSGRLFTGVLIGVAGYLFFTSIVVLLIPSAGYVVVFCAVGLAVCAYCLWTRIPRIAPVIAAMACIVLSGVMIQTVILILIPFHGRLIACALFVIGGVAGWYLIHRLSYPRALAIVAPIAGGMIVATAVTWFIAEFGPRGTYFIANRASGEIISGVQEPISATGILILYFVCWAGFAYYGLRHQRVSISA